MGRPTPTITAYFRGVRPGTTYGHGFYKPGMNPIGDDEPRAPWFDHRRRLGDGVQSLGPMEACWDLERDGYPEGQARFAREDGWTLVTLWDRSGDHRRSCNSVFAIQAADLTDEEALGLARRLFPEVFARMEAKLGREVRLAPATCPLCRQTLEADDG